jgi:Pyruvate/2-oxoacid:ferredoxin oxidoreductase delta subunit
MPTRSLPAYTHPHALIPPTPTHPHLHHEWLTHIANIAKTAHTKAQQITTLEENCIGFFICFPYCVFTALKMRRGKLLRRSLCTDDLE